jgi:hypothetical protein
MQKVQKDALNLSCVGIPKNKSFVFLFLTGGTDDWPFLILMAIVRAIMGVGGHCLPNIRYFNFNFNANTSLHPNG